MLKIGVIGSDSSHAEVYAGLLNNEDEKTGMYRYPDCRVMSIFGQDEKRTRDVADKCRIPQVVSKPEDMIGSVDAVMVLFRHGDLHMPYALPFIEAGMSVWVDKPFTVSTDDAVRLIEAARKSGAPLAGGSACKYIHDVCMIKNAVEGGSRIGKVNTAVLNFPATLESEYGGIHFYGSHLAEMTLAAFGHDPISVFASEVNGYVTAILKYNRYQVVMNFMPVSKQHCGVLYGENGIMAREIDITGCYGKAMDKFVRILKKEDTAESYEHFFVSVELLNAIEKSLKDRTEVFIEGMKNSKDTVNKKS